ncbi:hypothetical protein H6768_01615 [Candidatus Peribacteria bacterium]|nr:hypothetical protein [Candidatus Peribacteria bacterium]
MLAEIVWQQPTYFLEKDDIAREIYSCDATKDICRFNLQVLPKLDGEITSKLTCRITSDFGTEENDCNPNTVDVPEGNHSLTIEIVDVVTNELLITRIIQITGLTAPVSS